MFKTVQSRYALRCFLTGVYVAVGSLISSAVGSDLTGDEAVLALLLGVSGGLTAAGIGASSSSVEPNIGKK